jgi:hypothetical protein
MKTDGALRVAIENDQDFKPCPRIPAREPLYALDADGMASAWVRCLSSFSGSFNCTYFWIFYGLTKRDKLIAAIFVGLLSLLVLVASLAVVTVKIDGTGQPKKPASHASQVEESEKSAICQRLVALYIPGRDPISNSFACLKNGVFERKDEIITVNVPSRFGKLYCEATLDNSGRLPIAHLSNCRRE